MVSGCAIHSLCKPSHKAYSDTGDETWFEAASETALSFLAQGFFFSTHWQASAQRCRGAMTVSHSISAAPSWDSFWSCPVRKVIPKLVR